MTDNHENNDELNHLELEGDEAPQKTGLVANLSEAWKTKPIVKLVVIGVVLVAVIAVVSNFISNDNQPSSVARVAISSDSKSQAGGDVSQYVKKQIDLDDQRRQDKAKKEGGGFMPTPVGKVNTLDDLQRKNDPLNELRGEVEKLKEENNLMKRQQPAPPQIQQQQAPHDPADDALAQAMQHELNAVAEAWKPKGMRAVAIADTTDKNVGNGQGTVGGTSSSSTANGASAVCTSKVLIPAGTVNYAQMLTEANSDVPGPILAQIVSGPFSGDRAIGSFDVRDEYLILHFTHVFHKGKDYNFDAVAIDPDTTLTGLQTEYDGRYFMRVILPASAAFLQGLGAALTTPSNTSVTTTGTTTITSQAGLGMRQGLYSGLSRSADIMGQFFQNQANLTRPLVVVASGTPMGLFYSNSVMDQNVTDPTCLNNNTTQSAYPQNQNGANANPNNQMNRTVVGYGGSQQSDTSVPYQNQNSRSGYQGGMPGYGGLGSGYGNSLITSPGVPRY